MVVEKAWKDYKDIKDEYDSHYEEAPIKDEDRAYRWFAKQVLQSKPKTKHVLDVACGGGYFCRELYALNKAIEMHGIDISSTALKIAEKEFPQGEYALSVAEDLPFSDNFFDIVTCLGSLEHFLDISKALNETKRVLKADGLFFVLVPNIFWFKDIFSVLVKKNRITRNQTHERFASYGEWREVFEDHGLKVVKSIKYNGIAESNFKQILKDILIPERFSYHFLYICQKVN